MWLSSTAGCWTALLLAALFGSTDALQRWRGGYYYPYDSHYVEQHHKQVIHPPEWVHRDGTIRSYPNYAYDYPHDYYW